MGYSSSMSAQPPIDPAEHARDFAYRYESDLDCCAAQRMTELGIPKHLVGASDFDGDGRWMAFIARERQGGNITTGITVNSGVLNPALVKGNGSWLWARARLRDRLDAIIAHEFEEDRTGSHEGALRAAPKTELPITEGARRILRAMAR